MEIVTANRLFERVVSIRTTIWSFFNQKLQELTIKIIKLYNVQRQGITISALNAILSS